MLSRTNVPIPTHCHKAFLCIKREFNMPWIFSRGDSSEIEECMHIFAQSLFLLNITCHQAISSVAKIHHMLGRGFIIQQVILIFIKCFSVSQSELFLITWKYNIIHSCSHELYLSMLIARDYAQNSDVTHGIYMYVKKNMWHKLWYSIQQ